MTPAASLALQPVDWLNLFLYYVSISLLAVGGAIAAAPDMHRFLVERQGWITELQFNAAIAIAQAAPGPNVLFVGLLGWNMGLNAGGPGAAGWAAATLGMALSLIGIMLPSTVLTWLATRWGHRNRHRRSVRAFKQGLAPVVIGLLLATAWLLGSVRHGAGTDPRLWVLSGVCALVVWRTRIHLLWLLAGGALLGALGVV